LVFSASNLGGICLLKSIHTDLLSHTSPQGASWALL
jgi:hypothetical protein